MDRIASTFIDPLVRKGRVSVPFLFRAAFSCNLPLKNAGDGTDLIGLDPFRLTLPPSLGANTLSGARAR